MSFKSLGTFNLAMLEKQGWRIMTNPDTLIARIYKARYFPHCNFFESTIGHKPSFVWRSICNSKFILKAGSRWKICDDTSIPIWNNCRKKMLLFSLFRMLLTHWKVCVYQIVYNRIIRLGMFLFCTLYFINKLWNISLIRLYIPL